jgi:hypothetical protein
MTNPGAIFEFDVHFDEAGARIAERAFLVRSTRELRFFETFVAPVLLGVAAIAAYYFRFDGWVVYFFGTFAVIATALPVVMYFLRPAAAARFVRQHPVRQFRLTPDGLTITTSERAQSIPWRRIVAAWDAGPSLLLILGPHASLALPKASMPEGAADFIQESIGSARQGSDGDSKGESSRNGRFLAWLSQKRNFLFGASLAWGVPMAAWLIWYLGSLGIPLTLYVVALVVLATAFGAPMFGLLFWLVYWKDRSVAFRPKDSTGARDGRAAS